MKTVLVVTILALLPLGGRAFQDTPGAPGKEAMDLSGQHSGIVQPRKVVIRDAKAFAALWKAHSRGASEMPAPTVDFKKQDVVGYFAGAKPTGGYAVILGEIKRKGKYATVQATLVKPGVGDIVTEAFTQPFALRAVPKLPPFVRFVVTEKVRHAE